MALRKDNNKIEIDQSSINRKDLSHATRDRVEACKQYIERKYARHIQEEKEKKYQWEQFAQKMIEHNITSHDQDLIKQHILHKEGEYLRKKRTRVTAKDFEPLKIIGRGAFGEVRICKDKLTEQIVAVKKMKKNEMLSKNQIAHVRAERDILAMADIPWIVELKYSFQDDKYLYLVMEYLPGGDLMTLLMKKDILSEDDSRFYIAEIIMAVESIHKMNFIHRDLKPDNILIDNLGHLKLSDFGLCKHTEIKTRIDFNLKKNQQDFNKFDPSIVLSKRPDNFKRNRQLAFSTVGTPDYIAPEVFSQQGYTQTVDWWSIGVILFEMVVGYPPFFSDDPQTTCQKILNWKKTFIIPMDAKLSQSCQDLIKGLISDQSDRLGTNGVQEIKNHPFFNGLDWKKLREKIAPYLPEIKGEIDTDNFENFKEDEPWYVPKGKRARKKDDFHGYSFKREYETTKSPILSAADDIENLKPLPFLKVDKIVKVQSISPMEVKKEGRSLSIFNKNQSGGSPFFNMGFKQSQSQQESLGKNPIQLPFHVPKIIQPPAPPIVQVPTTLINTTPPVPSQIQPTPAITLSKAVQSNSPAQKVMVPPIQIAITSRGFNGSKLKQQKQQDEDPDTPKNQQKIVPVNPQAVQLLKMFNQLNDMDKQQNVKKNIKILNSQIIINKNNNNNQNYLLAQSSINKQKNKKKNYNQQNRKIGLPNLAHSGSPNKQGNQFLNQYSRPIHFREGSPRPQRG